MSVAGLKKQFYKATQLVSEKVGGAEGTKLDDDFKEMEKKVDVTSKAVTEVLTRTIEYLQPNPASRAKLTMLNTMSKIRGQVKNPGYPQSEGLLGECMIRYGKELGEDSNFGDALLDAGESMKRLAEVKDSLDIEVKQNFIDPLQNLCDKDLKEIQHHLKKLEGRRLDFDYKKKRQGKIPDEELRQAMEKFEESKEVAETSMHNLLETDIEQVSQLSALVDAQLDYHRQAVQILDELAEKLKRRMREASSRPKREYKPKPRETYDFREPDQSNGGFSCNPTPKASASFRSDKPSRASVRSIREFPPSALLPVCPSCLLLPPAAAAAPWSCSSLRAEPELSPELTQPHSSGIFWEVLHPQKWGLARLEELQQLPAPRHVLIPRDQVFSHQTSDTSRISLFLQAPSLDLSPSCSPCPCGRLEGGGRASAHGVYGVWGLWFFLQDLGILGLGLGAVVLGRSLEQDRAGGASLVVWGVLSSPLMSGCCLW
ncbi:endophilin-A2 isoform X1 [Molothrus aeneus]|uniref:endophilin-A2 isoform X1 n=1 Tax=Molothrus aeneus TaxID=84833 RepID=UPI0034594838